MDAKQFLPHMVTHYANAADPISYVSLGRYIMYAVPSLGLYDDIDAQATQVCLDTAQNIIDGPDDRLCKWNDGKPVTAAEIKRDLMALIEAGNG